MLLAIKPTRTATI